MGSKAVRAMSLDHGRSKAQLHLEKRVPPLPIVATFVFDLLSIHPFRDGNGRV
jgi:Fic family protein